MRKPRIKIWAGLFMQRWISHPVHDLWLWLLPIQNWLISDMPIKEWRKLIREADAGAQVKSTGG